MLSGKEKFNDPYLKKRFTKKKDTESKVYYISHYGTPRRTAKMKPPAICRVASVTNVPCTSSRALVPTTNLKCSRSLSLQDLSPSIKAHLLQRRDRTFCKEDGMPPTDGDEPPSEKTRLLALKVYSRLLRKAWGRSRRQAEQRVADVTLATAQISQLRLQTSSLKTLLKSDEQTISGSFREISTLRSLLAKLQEEYDRVKKEREEAREAAESAKAELQQARTESHNDKNSLLLARSEAAALETQLERERDKIMKLKAENKALTDKADKCSMNLKDKTEKITRLSENMDQLEKQISSYTQLLRSSEIKNDEYQRNLEDCSSRLKGLKKELAEAHSRESRLRTQLDEMAEKGREQAVLYNNAVKDQAMKLVRLEAELALKDAVPLGTRFLKAAALALNFPLVFLTALVTSRGL